MIKAIKTLADILIGIIAVTALSMVISAALGVRVLSVTSGSMEPAIHTGSLIYVKPADPREIKKNDIITFAIAEDMTATHRVIEIIQSSDADEGLQFVTKGDANDAKDAAPVLEKNLIGRPVVVVPLLGFVVTYIKSVKGLVTIAAVLVAALTISVFSRNRK